MLAGYKNGRIDYRNFFALVIDANYQPAEDIIAQ